MATKTTTKKTTSKKAIEKKEKKIETTKKVVAKSTSATASTKKTTTSKKADDSTTKTKKTVTKKVSSAKGESNGVETSKKYDSSTNVMPVRHEKQFGQNKFYGRRKKFCKLCAKGIEHVDYKDIELLSKYLNHNMKISSRKQTSACASHQRRISNAIKRARIVALIHCVKD